MKLRKKLLTIALLASLLALPAIAAKKALTNFSDYTSGRPDVSRTFSAVDDAITALTVSTTPGNDTVTSAKIVNGAILNADINASAAIDFSKFAALSSGNLLVGSAGNVATSVALSGDGTLSNAGALSVTDLTISGEAQGEILYNDGSNWVSLNVGTAGYSLLTNGAGQNPSWGIPTLATTSNFNNTITAEAGASDYTLDFGTAGGAYTLTVPAVGGARTFAFINETQTFTAAQTLPNTGLHLLDTNASHDLVIVPGSDLTADRNLTITTGDAARTITLGGAITTTGDLITVGDDSLTFTTGGATDVTLPTTGTLATLGGIEAITGVKTFTTPKLEGGANDTTITAANQTNAAAVATIPDIGDAADNFVMDNTAATITLKTIDADSNTISNINADELDPIAIGNYGVKGVLTYNLTNQAAAVNIYSSNAPFKFLITNVHSISTSADGGTWKLNNGAGGAGTDVTNAVTVAASADDIDTPSDITYAEADIAANGSLSIVPDGGGVLDCIIFIEFIRID